MAYLENMGNRNFFGTWVAISILRTRISSKQRSVRKQLRHIDHTYVFRHHMNVRSCRQKPRCQQGYTIHIVWMLGKTKKDKCTHNSMNPSAWDDHSVPLHQFDFENFINHISQPSLILKFTSWPSFICGEICWSGFDEIEYLKWTLKDCQTSRMINRWDLWTTEDMIIYWGPCEINMPVLEIYEPGKMKSDAEHTVQALATPIRQYSCTFGYTWPFPFLVLGQKFSTQSKSLTILGGKIISESLVPEISKDITFKIFSRLDGSKSK